MLTAIEAAMDGEWWPRCRRSQALPPCHGGRTMSDAAAMRHSTHDRAVTRGQSPVVAGSLGGADDAGQGLADAVSGLVGVGSAGVQPGHHRLDGDHRGQLGGPLRPGTIADHLG
jgi:hypothetical protein